MRAKDTVMTWFKKWEDGDFQNLPIGDHFVHISPFGKMEGKQTYLNTVQANKDKFLGYRFDIHDVLSDESTNPKRVCVRYTARQGDFELDVSEWHLVDAGTILEVAAYYHIGEIRTERQLA